MPRQIRHIQRPDISDRISPFFSCKLADGSILHDSAFVFCGQQRPLPDRKFVCDMLPFRHVAYLQVQPDVRHHTAAFPLPSAPYSCLFGAHAQRKFDYSRDERRFPAHD